MGTGWDSLCRFGMIVELQVAQLHAMGGLLVQSSRFAVAVVKSLHTGACTCTTECKTTVCKLIPSSRASVAPVNTVKLWLYNVTYMVLVCDRIDWGHFTLNANFFCKLPPLKCTKEIQP